jgi:hypothetical protein
MQIKTAIFIALAITLSVCRAGCPASFPVVHTASTICSQCKCGCVSGDKCPCQEYPGAPCCCKAGVDQQCNCIGSALTIDGCWEYRCASLSGDFIYNGHVNITGNSGTYTRTPDAHVSGSPSIDGRVWTGTWYQEDAGSGPIAFMLSIDGNSFTSYNEVGAEGFSWAGTRMDECQ